MNRIVRTSLLGTAVLALILACLSVLNSGSATAAAQGEVAEEGRRCAYLGKWGSFHLIDQSGSAAYTLGKDRYLADLVFHSEDDNYWYYVPSRGDNSTNMWAFSRRPNRCGLYWVLRRGRAGWRRYEQTRAWGDGLNQTRTSAEAGPLRLLQQQFRALELRVEELEKNSTSGLPNGALTLAPVAG